MVAVNRISAQNFLGTSHLANDKLIGVALCNADDNVLLAATSGKCIRFPVEAVRVFKGRTSTGVRGMRLSKDDHVMSMAVLAGQDVTTEERDAYLKAAPWKSDPNEPTLSAERLAELAEREQFILSVTINGFGKRTSAYEYRTAGRGGLGITNIETSERNGSVVASFPVEPTDQVMMVTDQAKIIRTPIGDVRIAGRATQGVTLFKVADGETIVSVAKMGDTGDDDEAEDVEGDVVDAEGSDAAPEDNSDTEASEE